MFFQRILFSFSAPWKTIRLLRGMPLFLVLLVTILAERFSSFLTTLLLQFAKQVTKQRAMPDWAYQNIEVLCNILPYLIAASLFIATATGPMRLAVLRQGSAKFLETIHMFWLCFIKASQGYGYAWTILPWYLIPLIAVLLTERIAPYFVPEEYQVFFQGCITVLAIVSFIRALPVVMLPVVASLGLYEPHHARMVAFEVVRLEKSLLSFIMILWGASLWSMRYLSTFLNDDSVETSLMILVSILFLMVLSGACITPMAHIEQQRSRQ